MLSNIKHRTFLFQRKEEEEARRLEEEEKVCIFLRLCFNNVQCTGFEKY